MILRSLALLLVSATAAAAHPAAIGHSHPHFEPAGIALAIAIGAVATLAVILHHRRAVARKSDERRSRHDPR